MKQILVAVGSPVGKRSPRSVDEASEGVMNELEAFHGLGGDVGVAETGVLKGDGWVDGNALVVAAELIEIVEEAAVLGVVAP
ncbi:hypothetical protein NL676_021558 [Syzygium grande]|nr:hypothetical protein NL676_021558 [Syzygium grande]